jgi:hypothetical protein
MIGGSGTTAWLHGAACHTGDWERPELAGTGMAGLGDHLAEADIGDYSGTGSVTNALLLTKKETSS